METGEALTRYIGHWENHCEAMPIRDGIIRMSVPLYDPKGDEIQFYIVPRDGGYFLTDDSGAIAELEISGRKYDRSDVEGVATLCGVKLNDQDELCVEATAENFGEQAHALVQAIWTVCTLLLTDRITLTPASGGR